jgi:hypothetical protein
MGNQRRAETVDPTSEALKVHPRSTAKQLFGAAEPSNGGERRGQGQEGTTTPETVRSLDGTGETLKGANPMSATR